MGTRRTGATHVDARDISDDLRLVRDLALVIGDVRFRLVDVAGELRGGGAVDAGDDARSDDADDGDPRVCEGRTRDDLVCGGWSSSVSVGWRAVRGD